MREERLLERIRAQAKRPGRSTADDPKKRIDSVLLHLQKVLNTRHGNVQIADDYGLPDFNDVLHTESTASREIEKSIRQTIIKYEQRLKAVRVRFIPEEDKPLSLSFQIYARLEGEEIEQPVVFESLVEDGGKITIRG